MGIVNGLPLALNLDPAVERDARSFDAWDFRPTDGALGGGGNGGLRPGADEMGGQRLP